MSLMVTLIRNLLGSIIVLFDLITRGRKLRRTKQVQAQVEKDTQAMTLYQFFGCPFCVKTRRAIHKMNLPIEKRSVSKGSPHRDELLKGGGKIQTPCLKIEKAGEETWLYDSSAIIEYLESRFAPQLK